MKGNSINLFITGKQKLGVRQDIQLMQKIMMQQNIGRY